MQRPLTESQARDVAIADLMESSGDNVDLDEWCAEFAAEELQMDPCAVALWITEYDKYQSLDVAWWEHRPASDMGALEAFAVVMAASESKNIVKAAHRLRELFNAENLDLIIDRARDIRALVEPCHAE